MKNYSTYKTVAEKASQGGVDVKKELTGSMGMSEPLVSAVIPTYNSEKTLEKCLKSIRRQTYRNLEIIVVDKFSKDRTVEIAKRYGARIIYDEGERTRAKNIGLKKAKGKYVLFVDSDMELSKDVVEECVELAEKNNKVGGIIIPERFVGDGFWVKVRDFELVR